MTNKDWYAIKQRNQTFLLSLSLSLSAIHLKTNFLSRYLYLFLSLSLSLSLYRSIYLSPLFLFSPLPFLDSPFSLSLLSHTLFLISVLYPSLPLFFFLPLIKKIELSLAIFPHINCNTDLCKTWISKPGYHWPSKVISTDNYINLLLQS